MLPHALLSTLPTVPCRVLQVIGKLGRKGWAEETEAVQELLEPGPLGCRAATACSNGETCPQSSWTCLSSQLIFPFDFHPSFPSAPSPAVASSSVCCRSRDAPVLLLEADTPQLPMDIPMDMGPADGQSPLPSAPCSKSWGMPGTAEGHSSGTSPSRAARFISAAAPCGMGSLQLRVSQHSYSAQSARTGQWHPRHPWLEGARPTLVLT